MTTPISGKYMQRLNNPLVLGGIFAGATLLGDALLPTKGKGIGRSLLEAAGAGLGAGALHHAVAPTLRNAGPLSQVLIGNGPSITGPLGALGGIAVGGLASSVGNAIGVPGLSPGIDPESYGSSNSNYIISQNTI